MDNSKNIKGVSEAQYLKEYDINKYDRPSVTADIMLLTIADCELENYRKLPKKQLKVLLIKRKEHPYLGSWALPGGFINLDESLEEGAYRELREETGISNIYLEQLYTYGEVNRDPRGRVISTSYLSLVDKDELNIHPGSDAEEAKWFDIEYKILEENNEEVIEGQSGVKDYQLTFTNELENLKATVKVSRLLQGKQVSYKREVVESNGLAFDHGQIIQQGIERLRSKLEYTDIVFQLMPTLFTLSELQKTYEEILGKTLLKANFRRKISKMVAETDDMTTDGGHRPSKLYKFNAFWEN